MRADLGGGANEGRSVGTRARACAVLAGVFAVLGCAGVNTEIRAPRAKYPVSFSPAVPESGGRVLLAGRDLKKVGELSESYWRWSIAYDSIRGDVDLSEDVNQAVQAHGGEAIVNLSVTSTECFLDWFVILNWLPFWPTCAIVSVEGEVVRRRAPRRISKTADENATHAAREDAKP